MIEHHSDFLRKVLKGCLLSRKLTLLQSLMQLKKQAARFTQVSQALQVQPDGNREVEIVPQGMVQNDVCHYNQTSPKKICRKCAVMASQIQPVCCTQC